MPLSVVIDGGNGTAGAVLPLLVKKMKWDHVTLLCEAVDGNYPNHEADPTVYKNMIHVKDALQNTAALVGIGLDGDCDRMAAMTKQGFLVPGDQLLAVFAQEILKEYPNTTVVFDIKASLGLIELLEQWGAKAIIAPCGHAIIKEKMDAHKGVIGGELSCHFFFKDRHFGYDDGIYAMMRLFEIMVTASKSLEQLISIFPKKFSSPEIRIACDEAKKQEIIQSLYHSFEKRKDAQIITIDGIRVTLAYGWGNLRASNTQPVLSLRFEADSAQNLERIETDFIDLLSVYFDAAMLRKIILQK